MYEWCVCAQGNFEFSRLLSQRLVQLCQKYPNLIIRFQQDIMDFVTGLKNLGPTKENFFVHLVSRSVLCPRSTRVVASVNGYLHSTVLL